MNGINWKTRVVCFGISVLFGWMIAAMALSGTWNIRQFYDCGKIYDILYEGRMMDGVGIRLRQAGRLLISLRVPGLQTIIMALGIMNIW